MLEALGVVSISVEEPPDYTDAVNLPTDGTTGVRSVSMYGGAARRRSSTGSRMSRLRSRLFSRSVSANAGAPVTGPGLVTSIVVDFSEGGGVLMYEVYLTCVRVHTDRECWHNAV